MNNMLIKKGLFGTVSLSLLAAGLQLPARAEAPIPATTPAEASIVEETAAVDTEATVAESAIAETGFKEPTIQLSDLTFSEPQEASWEQATTLVESREVLPTEEFTAEGVATEEFAVEALPAEKLIAADSRPFEASQPVTEASELAYPAIEEPEELAQVRRRRTRGGAASGANFIGIGADFGYADDVSFAAISKFSFTERWAVRPTVLLGDDFSVLVPVTYDFSRFNTEVGSFNIRPYAGVGASFSDSDDDDSDLNLLLSAGVDVPISQRFTLNGQVNWGVLDDSQFGATVGIGYNLGNIFQ
ncbi:MAG: hypothetical protein AAFR25_09215 [Cyanobacteria bacterium J06629_19]